jgi:2-dehydro-3-deoxyphosphogluconate aldolase/(4S)-4-hydroxy-2-oxoglutarate aldolase
VKVFPARTVGPTYIKDILGPLPQVRLLPTGGVGLENAAGFIRAGAAAVGAGSALVDREAVARGDYEAVAERARRFVEAVEAA